MDSGVGEDSDWKIAGIYGGQSQINCECLTKSWHLKSPEREEQQTTRSGGSIILA